MSNDGGPAFPTTDANYREGDYGTMGMSLRDWFAAHAPPKPHNWGAQATTPASQEARWRFAFADEMLAARSTRDEKGDSHE